MLYLASQSPRRKHLLGWLGLEFEVVDHGVNESEYRSDDGFEMVKNLCLAKAYGGAERTKKGLVIGSDLTVELKGKTYDKPKDLKDARRILKVLSGKTHIIYCGLAVMEAETGKAVVSVDEVKVRMKTYNETVIDEYVRKFQVLDKGGAYSIQFELEEFGSLVGKIEGNMTAVIGLPMEYLENLLKEFEVTNLEDWRKRCQEEMGYDS